MDDTLPEAMLQSPIPTKPARKGHRWLRWLPFAIVLAMAYCAYDPPQPMRLSSGRSVDVVTFDRLTQVTLNAAPNHRMDTLFRLRYYADVTGSEAMLADAKLIAPFLFPIADSLGLRHLVIEPAAPLFRRSFPIAVTSWQAFYRRDTNNVWVPERP